MFISNNHMSFEYLFIPIIPFIVSIFTKHLISINLIHLRPGNSIVQIYSICLILLNHFTCFIYKQIPSLEFPIVQNHSVLVIDRPAFASIMRVFTTWFINVVQNVWAVNFIVSTWTYPISTVSYYFHPNFFWFFHQLQETTLSS